MPRDPDVLPEIEVRVARFFDIPISDVRNPESALVLPSYDTAQLRRVRDIDRDLLGPAIHSAIRLSQAVIRNLRLPGVIEAPIANSLEWRRILQSGANRYGAVRRYPQRFVEQRHPSNSLRRVTHPQFSRIGMYR